MNNYILFLKISGNFKSIISRALFRYNDRQYISGAFSLVKSISHHPCKLQFLTQNYCYGYHHYADHPACGLSGVTPPDNLQEQLAYRKAQRQQLLSCSSSAPCQFSLLHCHFPAEKHQAACCTSSAPDLTTATQHATVPHSFYLSLSVRLQQVAIHAVLWWRVITEQRTVSEDQRLPKQLLGLGRGGRRHI